MKLIKTITVVAILEAAICAPALASRYPDGAERQKIEDALTKAGFTSWGEVELDNNRVWEVDDARHRDGNRYDVDIDASTLKIIRKEQDY